VQGNKRKIEPLTERGADRVNPHRN